VNVFLTGYRGVGKTTVAKLLAKATGRDWVDADDEIVRAAGMPIATIFAQQGETAFRDIEAEVVAALAARADTVISLGGGAILRASNREIIAQSVAQGSVVVWLQASAEIIHRRLNADPHTASQRPNLTQSGGLAEIQQLLAARNPLYDEVATMRIETEVSDAGENSSYNKSPEQIVDEILLLLQA